jgi:hypothetical protein
VLGEKRNVRSIMRRNTLIVCMCLFMQIVPLRAQEVNPDMDSMLKSAESLFQAIQKKEYARIWELLSRRSKQTIVHDTLKAIQSKHDSITEEAIGQDFAAGSDLSKAYWDSFVSNFDPTMILEQSRWEMGTMKGNQAQIKATYRKSQKPAYIKMFKEDGVWKVGLTESFWNRKK